MSQLVNSGNNYYYNRDYKKALEYAELAIEKNPNDKNAWLLKGMALLGMDHPIKAIFCFNKIIKLDNKFYDAYIYGSDAYLVLGNYEKAEEYADRALDISKRSFMAIFAWSHKGLIAYTSRMYRDSERYYTKAKELAEPYCRKAKNPKDTEQFSQIWCMLGQLFYHKKENDFDAFYKALEHFDVASNLNKKDAHSLIGKAIIFQNVDYYDEEKADENIAEALKRDANLVYASWIDSGVDLEKEGNYPEAMRYFDKVSPDSCYISLAIINKGILFLRQKDYDNSMICFDKALATESHYPALALIGKCISLANTNKLAEAINCLNKARDFDINLEWAKCKDLIYLAQSGDLFFFNGYDIDFVGYMIKECQNIANNQLFDTPITLSDTKSELEDPTNDEFNHQGFSEEILSDWKRIAFDNGIIGENYIEKYLSFLKLNAEIRDYKWISKNDPFAPYDFFIIDQNGESVLLDAKSTVGAFSQKFFVSYNELKKMVQCRERYDIYRVYNIDNSSAMLRICRDIRSFSQSILEILEKLPNGVIADSVAISPLALKFDAEIILQWEYPRN